MNPVLILEGLNTAETSLVEEELEELLDGDPPEVELMEEESPYEDTPEYELLEEKGKGRALPADELVDDELPGKDHSRMSWTYRATPKALSALNRIMVRAFPKTCVNGFKEDCKNGRA